MSRTRVLFFHPALAPYRINLFNELSDRFELKVVFLHENLSSQAFDQKEMMKRFRCQYSYLTSGFDVLGKAYRWGIRRNINEFRPHIVVCTEFAPSTLSVGLLKILNRRHAMVIFTTDTPDIFKRATFGRRIARYICTRIADSMIVYTESARNIYCEYGVVRDRVFLCPNIQDDVAFRASLVDSIPIATEYMQRYHLSGKRIVLFVGRLVKLKGIDRLIRALVETRKAVGDTVLVVVGDGPERHNLEDLADEYGLRDYVRFAGHLEGCELYAWYLVGHVLALPSDSETFGAVVNEALLAGMKVLCSSRAGARELIREGFNGFVAEPSDFESITMSLSKMLSIELPRIETPIALKESLMVRTFPEAVGGFVDALNCALRRTRSAGA